MDLRKTSNGGQHAWAVRCVAIIAALFFAMTSLVAVLHHHGGGRLSTAHTVFSHQDTSAHVDAATHSALSITAADCMLCDWMTTSATPASTITWAVAVAFSFLSIQLFQVRLAALCSRPAPRRGLRAPPVACVA